MARRTGRNPCVNASGEAIRTRSGGFPGRTCGTCQRQFKPKKGDQRFCGPDCRQMAWWVDHFIRAVLDGRAEGLRQQLAKLAAADARRTP